jgi:hypothetical protein
VAQAEPSRFSESPEGGSLKYFHFFRDYLSSTGYTQGIETDFICQGRRVTQSDLDWLRNSMAAHPDWSRKRLADELCQWWQWRNAQGRLKDFAARSLLLKLQARGRITLPTLQENHRTRGWELTQTKEPVAFFPPLMAGRLTSVQPLHWVLPLAGSASERRFHDHLHRHHYLGARVVGENLKYLVQTREGSDVACLLFGAAAWQVRARDGYVGWSAAQRDQGLRYVANNSRFVVLPWVQVRDFASHVLSVAVRRLSADWQRKYGHPIWLVETFVDRELFAGACYRAANWRPVGLTRGRGRQGPDPRTPTASIKEVYLHPLHRDFRQHLRGEAA